MPPCEGLKNALDPLRRFRKAAEEKELVDKEELQSFRESNADLRDDRYALQRYTERALSSDDFPDGASSTTSTEEIPRANSPYYLDGHRDPRIENRRMPNIRRRSGTVDAYCCPECGRILNLYRNQTHASLHTLTEPCVDCQLQYGRSKGRSRHKQGTAGNCFESTTKTKDTTGHVRKHRERRTVPRHSGEVSSSSSNSSSSSSKDSSSTEEDVETRPRRQRQAPIGDRKSVTITIPLMTKLDGVDILQPSKGTERSRVRGPPLRTHKRVKTLESSSSSLDDAAVKRVENRVKRVKRPIEASHHHHRHRGGREDADAEVLSSRTTYTPRSRLDRSPYPRTTSTHTSRYYRPVVEPREPHLPRPLLTPRRQYYYKRRTLERSPDRTGRFEHRPHGSAFLEELRRPLDRFRRTSPQRRPRSPLRRGRGRSLSSSPSPPPLRRRRSPLTVRRTSPRRDQSGYYDSSRYYAPRSPPRARASPREATMAGGLRASSTRATAGASPPRSRPVACGSPLTSAPSHPHHHRHVRFEASSSSSSPSPSPGCRRRPAAPPLSTRERQDLRDFDEGERDQKRFEAEKREARKGIREGPYGGVYEVDGAGDEPPTSIGEPSNARVAARESDDEENVGGADDGESAGVSHSAETLEALEDDETAAASQDEEHAIDEDQASNDGRRRSERNSSEADAVLDDVEVRDSNAVVERDGWIAEDSWCLHDVRCFDAAVATSSPPSGGQGEMEHEVVRGEGSGGSGADGVVSSGWDSGLQEEEHEDPGDGGGEGQELGTCGGERLDDGTGKDKGKGKAL
ncbi:MAG: hypothetical protein M1828_005586 [Chrysothrix sp. TS-e1954]|nr:MAG: hypothetical protein M1828_005586 [Chrysothrix sp. TS-e1954]